MSFRQMKASEDGFSLYAEKIENVKSFKYSGSPSLWVDDKKYSTAY